MSTSNSYSFTVTRDDIINAAFRTMGVFGLGETASATDITNAAQALNLILKTLATKGINLWTVDDLSFSTVVGQTTYPFPGTTTSPVTSYKPLRIIDAYIRDSNNNDTPLQIISQKEYLQYGQKSTASTTNSIYYDKGIATGTLFVFPASSDTTHNIHIVVQRPIQDAGNSTDNPDFPTEWFKALKWGLASELSLEYEVDLNRVQLIEMKASKFLEDMLSWDQDDASISFTPNAQMRN